MPVGHWNLEFLNHNSQRKYPLAQDGDATDTTDSFKIPDDFIVELDLPTHAGLDVDPGRFFVLNIGSYATGYSVIIGYQPSSGIAVVVASALIPRQTHTRNTSYALGGIGDFDDTIGKIVIGRLDNIADQPPGFWTFDLASTRLEPDAVRPIIRGISSIVCVNGDQRSVPVRGDVELVAGANMQIVPIIVSGQNPIIRFSAINGAGTIEECVCEGESAVTDPIKTILGVRPTPSGDFNFVGSDCINIEEIDNGIRFVDTCAQPCCGCTELEKITQDLERFGSQAASVTDFISRLGTSVSTMELTVLGAKIGDQSCITCE